VKTRAAVCAVVLCVCVLVACRPGGGDDVERDDDPTSSSSGAAATSAHVDLRVDLGGGVEMEFVLVPAGAFTMGASDGFPAEKPPHRVVIAKPFHLARYEATQEQWRAVMGANPSRHKGPKLPVDNVSWNDCREFLRRVNERTSCATFVLPSEAQWEYACRAGGEGKWCFGDDESALARHAWYLANCRSAPRPVGAATPNAWGLYDMHGNVWEWCEDAWHENYVGAPTDGSAWTSGGDARRVRRGGSWYDSSWLARSAYRLGFSPDFRAENLGFRPARLVAP